MPSQPSAHPCFSTSSATSSLYPPFRLASLKDNYSWILTLTDPASGAPCGAAIVDPTDSLPIQTYFKHSPLPLLAIINTHHHYDHTGGNDYLVRHYAPSVYGSAQDRARIPHLNQPLDDGTTFQLNQLSLVAQRADGHTRGHMMYHEPQQKWLFTGDAVFSLGCGKMFEGTGAMMVASLAKLQDFPADTLMFCGHEYTLANAQFSLTVDPHNIELQHFYHRLAVRRQANPNFATIPSTLGFERNHNPFLQLANPAFLSRANIPEHLRAAHGHRALQEELFLWLRKQKDEFIPHEEATLRDA